MRRGLAVAGFGGALAAVVAVGLALRAPARRPNLLVILWDTVRADRTSLLDPARPTTPRMAAWAASGRVFTQATSPDMWTVPAHASLFTGLAPVTHGAGLDHRWLDAERVTLAEQLGAAGYDTYAFSANPNLSPTRVNLLQGFDVVDLSWEGAPARKSVAATRRKLLPEDLSTEISPANADRRRDEGLYYNAAEIAHKGLARWLDARVGERPWMAYLSYMEAHKPRVPSLAARRRVADEDTVHRGLRTPFTFQDQLLFSHGVRTYDDAELAAIRAVYDAALVDLDDATADLLDDLDARGVLDDTIVVFTSDHGEQLGEHHRFGHRSDLWQTLLHVPLVIAWPGHVAPGREDRPVSTQAVMGTVLGLVGLPVPDGADATDLLRGPPAAVFSEALDVDRAGFRKVQTRHPELREADWLSVWRSVREGSWKLLERRSPDDARLLESALYDLDADPDEAIDLAGARPEVARALAERLAERDRTLPRWRAGDAVPADDAETRRQLELLGYLPEE